jgi:N-acetylneuraminic acid mutarotase
MSGQPRKLIVFAALIAVIALAAGTAFGAAPESPGTPEPRAYLPVVDGQMPPTATPTPAPTPTATAVPTPAGSWSPAASMSTPRNGLTATLLASGQVLVTGGLASDDPDSVVASAELYNPAKKSWSRAGSMSTKRLWHTATLLDSGKVLVVGGCTNPAGNSTLASAELYNPATNGWSVAGSMSGPRVVHTATLLNSGKVLVVGGAGTGGYLASAELYDPATNSWSPAASMSISRGYHTATLLPSGQVLVAGGFDGGVLASAELYTPSSNGWAPAGSMSTGRDGHTATLLPSGQVLVAGGFDINGDVLASAELYGPATNSWSAAGNMSVPRLAQTATLLNSGQVLVAGGVATYLDIPLADAKLYDAASNTWWPARSMSTARFGHTATLLRSGQVLVAGGGSYNDVLDDALASAELYTP